MEITVRELEVLWGKYVNDSSLRSEFRFGQWVCNRKLPRRQKWPECYYANTQEAWKLLYNKAKKN